MGSEELLVDLDADTGLVERPHTAILADFPWLGAQLVAEPVGDREVRLEIATVVDRGQEMDRDGVVEAGHRAVRVDRQLPHRGGGRDALPLGYAAALGEIGLQDGDVAVLDHAMELEAGVVVLAGGQRRAAKTLGYGIG